MTRYAPRPRTLLITTLVILLTAALAVPPAGAASQARDEVTRAAIDSMVDNLDISASEAADRFAAQPAQNALADKLTTRLGARAAGAWIDHDSGELRVNVLDAAAAQQVRDAGALPARVDVSLDRLAEAKAQLDRTAAPAGVSWSVDVPTNSLVVSVPAGARNATTRQFIAAARALDVPVTVETVAGRAVTHAFYGGEAITGSGGRCSAGFIAAASSGTQYVVTAGHCTDAITTWSGDGQTIGTTAASSFPGNDYGAIRINNPSALDPRGEVVNGGGTTNITGAGRVAVGATVCKTGSTTGTTCGQVVRYNVTVNYGSAGVVRQLTQTNLCTQRGDSGGPLFAGGQAQGVVSGGTDAPCSVSGFQSFFQPVDEILSAYGLTLR